MKKNVIKFIVAVLCGLVMLCACTQKEEIKEDKNPVSVENSDAGETVKEDKTEVNSLKLLQSALKKIRWMLRKRIL